MHENFFMHYSTHSPHDLQGDGTCYLKIYLNDFSELSNVRQIYLLFWISTIICQNWFLFILWLLCQIQ